MRLLRLWNIGTLFKNYVRFFLSLCIWVPQCLLKWRQSNRNYSQLKRKCSWLKSTFKYIYSFTRHVLGSYDEQQHSRCWAHTVEKNERKLTHLKKNLKILYCIISIYNLLRRERIESQSDKKSYRWDRASYGEYHGDNQERQNWQGVHTKLQMLMINSWGEARSKKIILVLQGQWSWEK